MAIAHVQQFRCLIPAGTAKAAPAVFPLALLALDIEWIEWEVPAGARGNVGFVIASAGQPVIPFTQGPSPNWIVADGYTAHWDTADLDSSTAWELRGYNLGLLDHTVSLRFGLAAPVAPASSSALPSLTLLNS